MNDMTLPQQPPAAGATPLPLSKEEYQAGVTDVCVIRHKRLVFVVLEAERSTLMAAYSTVTRRRSDAEAIAHARVKALERLESFREKFSTGRAGHPHHRRAEAP